MIWIFHICAFVFAYPAASYSLLICAIQLPDQTSSERSVIWKCIHAYICYELLISKVLRLACVNERSYSFTCHPHVYPQVEWAIRVVGWSGLMLPAIWYWVCIHQMNSTMASPWWQHHKHQHGHYFCYYYYKQIHISLLTAQKLQARYQNNKRI